MDHLARRSMKNAANCVKYGELQGSRNRDLSNAYCGTGIYLSVLRLLEGLLKFILAFLWGEQRSKVHITLHGRCCVFQFLKLVVHTHKVEGAVFVTARQRSAMMSLIAGCSGYTAAHLLFPCGVIFFPDWTSSQTRLPAEFKHIIQRRKGN